MKEKILVITEPENQKIIIDTLEQMSNEFTYDICTEDIELMNQDTINVKTNFFSDVFPRLDYYFGMGYSSIIISYNYGRVVGKTSEYLLLDKDLKDLNNSKIYGERLIKHISNIEDWETLYEDEKLLNVVSQCFVVTDGDIFFGTSNKDVVMDVVDEDGNDKRDIIKISDITNTNITTLTALSKAFRKWEVENE